MNLVKVSHVRIRLPNLKARSSFFERYDTTQKRANCSQNHGYEKMLRITLAKLIFLKRKYPSIFHATFLIFATIVE